MNLRAISFLESKLTRRSSPSLLQSSFELVEYVTLLREGIIEAYVGVVSALRESDQSTSFVHLPPLLPSSTLADYRPSSFFSASPGVLLPYVPGIINFLQLAIEDEDRSEAVMRGGLGLLGDLCETFPRGEIREFLLREWITTALKLGRGKGMSAETRKVARWTKDVSIRRVSFPSSSS